MEMTVDPTVLQILWFGLIAVLWAGYLVLEGFDFGVGMLLPILSKNEKEKRTLINTIGPVWDGNEVWLLTAGGATFAAFPEWYATLFSGFYLPLLLILVALIVRGVAFEYRSKIDSESWRKKWDLAILVGSWFPAILWGVAFGNIVRGVALNPDHNMNFDWETFFGLLNPYALLGGATTCLLFLMHGAIFIALKTKGDIQVRAGKLSHQLSWVATVVAAAFAIWTSFAFSENLIVSLAATALAALALVGVIITTKMRREGWAFILSAVVILAAVVLIFGSLYPYVMPDIDRGPNGLTIMNASSSEYTLTVMTWVAVVLTPIVLAYQSWSYWVFSKRLSAKSIPDPVNAGDPVH